MTLCYVALGSNLNDPLDRCREALDLLGAPPDVRVMRVSKFYCTEPVGVQEQDWYVNAVAEVQTERSPEGLLEHCRACEERMGRIRKERWGARIIDLDLLLCGDLRLATPELELPHPRLHQRRFVLTPLNDLIPQQLHPVLGKDFARLLAELHDEHAVREIPDSGWRPRA